MHPFGQCFPKNYLFVISKGTAQREGREGWGYMQGVDLTPTYTTSVNQGKANCLKCI